MQKVRVTAVNGRKVQADGKWLTAIGNRTVAVGDLVWTDGKCVYGHHSTNGGCAVIGSTEKGIPIFSANWYNYLYQHGNMENIANGPREKFLLYRGSRTKYFPRDDAVIDADMDAQGNIYTLNGTRAIERDPPSWSSYEVAPTFVVTVKRNNEILHSFDTRPYHEQARSACLSMRSGIDNSINDRLELYTGTICDVGYVDTEGHWGFYMAVGGSGSKKAGTVAVIRLYYVNEDGMRLLMYTQGSLQHMYPISKSEYYGGASGMIFPIHNGYYYTMVNRTAVSWGIYLPGIASMTIYTPEGEPIVTDNFATGTRFTIMRLGEGQYLLGVDLREVFILTISTTAGQDFGYQEDTTYVRNGIYLVENGSLRQLLSGKCCTLRLRYLRNIKKWKHSLAQK